MFSSASCVRSLTTSCSRLTSRARSGIQGSSSRPLDVQAELALRCSKAPRIGRLRARIGYSVGTGKFASFLGLTPSEHSSGQTRNRGRITKAGNRRVRRMLVESAWAYWRSPHMSRELIARSEGVSPAVREIAWATQRRLHRRLNALRHRHVQAKKALIAVTRELACAIWAVGQEEQLQG